MNRIDARTAPKTVNSDPRNEVRLRPAGLAVAIGSVLGLGMPGMAAAAPPLAPPTSTMVEARGETDTTVQVREGQPNVTDVRTATIKGAVAFNSFRKFDVAQGDVVNLYLPFTNAQDKAGSQINNLVNLVWDSRIHINGAVNSVLDGTNAIGAGRVFFVDPMGMVVHKGGVLNVGALSVATPTAGVMDDILNGGGALNRLMAGTLLPEQIDRRGEVDIQGQINAQNGVRVQARAIDVTGTILVQASGSGPFNLLHEKAAVNTGGDDTKIQLEQDASGQIQLRASSISDTGLGVRSAEATVTVGCDAGQPCGPSMLKADNIELSAQAIIDPGYDRKGVILADLEADLLNSVTNTDNLIGLGEALVAAGVDKVLGEQISVLHGTTTARVEVKDSATLEAGKRIDLHASTRQTVDNSAAGKEHETNDPVLDDAGKPVIDPATGKPKQKRQLFSLGAAYGQVNATTEAIIRAGAQVKAGGDLSVKADATTAVKIAAESVAVNNTAAAFTAAISNVNVSTKALVEGGAGATQINAGALDVSAVNQSSLETSATARADKSGNVGLAGAISLQDIAAEARLDRSVTTSKDGGSTGDVVVQAASITSVNKTDTLVGSPKPEPKPGEEEVKLISQGKDGLMTMAQSLVGAGFGKAMKALTDDGKDNTPSTQPAKAAPFRLGGAISFVSGEHAASASIGNNAAGSVAINAAGNVVVDSQVVDAEIANHAISNVIAKGKDDDGSAFALTGAVTIADLSHDARTLVGSGATISGQRIGLASDVYLPKDFSALTNAAPDFSSFDAFKTSISAAKDLITDPSDLFTSYAAARGSADDFALGASVSYFKSRNTARTDVASGAKLTATSGSSDAWTAALDGLDHRSKKKDEERARSRSYDAATSITANIDVTALHSAGDLGLKNLKTTAVGDTGVAVGGSVGYSDYENTAAAIVNDGVVINAAGGNIAVDAASKEKVVSLTLQSGLGGSYGVNGTASALDLSSRTLAGVSNKATLTAASVGIKADEDLFVWSVAGAVTMSNSLSVGASVAYQQMATDTHAFVGQVPQDFATGSAVGGPGAINTGELKVAASSGGLSGAVAAAGAVTTSKDGKLDEFEKKLAKERSEKNPGFLDSLKGRALEKVNGLEAMAGKAGNSSDSALSGYFSQAKEKLGGGDGGGGAGQAPQPKFGVAVSGSATVNRAQQKTRADVSNAVLNDISGKGLKLDIAAINKTLLVSISGALAVTAANSNNNQGSASVAGGVAYGDIRNDTSARLVQSDVRDAGAVKVSARNESEQVNVGLSVGVNASSDQSTAVAAAVSATVAMSRNQTAAELQGSKITGVASTPQNVAVTAVNESKIANGGGALYAGGKAGLGAAVTYADIQDGTRAAITGGQIDGMQDVTVRAADASRIIAAAASGGASREQGSVGLAGSVLVNQVANTTEASIGGGASVDIKGNLDVYAGTAMASDLAKPASGCDADGVSSGASVDYCGSAIGDVTVDANADTASSSDTKVQAVGRDSSAKSSIIAVAGMAQFGDNNAGIAFAYNTIKNSHSVSIGDATISAAGSNGISLTAREKAEILAVSAGIGGSTGNFTGVGSASYNAIANHTTVAVGPETATGKTSLNATGIVMGASDDSFIGALAGAATIGSKVAVGAALTINDIGNVTSASSRGATLVASDKVAVSAANKAKILAGAVAVGAAGNVALQGSAGWNEIGNTAEASISGGSVAAKDLVVDAGNDSRIYTLSGAVAGSSGAAAVGVAANIADIGDVTRATVDGAALQVSNKVDVTADATGATKTLAIAGALASSVAVAGSATVNRVHSTTDALLRNSTLDAEQANVTVRARDQRTIDSLAGGVAIGGSVGVGAAVAYNDIGGSTSATVTGNALNLNVRNLTVDADAASGKGNRIRTIAAGVGGGSAVGAAGSVAVNRMNGLVSAGISGGANIVAQDNVAVTAAQSQRVDVFAGAVAAGGTAGVGVGTVVNLVNGTTKASIEGAATQVTALGHGADLTVNSGERRNENTHSQKTDGNSLVDGDLATGTVAVRGLAVNAVTKQQINTIGVGAAFSTTPIFSASFAVMAAVNQISGRTVASIKDARINQHGLDGSVDNEGTRDIGVANLAQAVDVRASHHVATSSYVAGVAAGAGVSGTGALASNVFDGQSSASIERATVNAAGDVVVQSNTSHNALAIVTGLGAGLAGGAATGVVNTFSTGARAEVTGGKLDAGSLAINANNDNAGSLVGGAGALGAAAAVAGTALVNVGSAQTVARLGDGAIVDVSAALDVVASSRSDFNGVAVSGAGAGGTGVAGMAQVQLLQNQTQAVVENAAVKAGSTRVDANDVLKLSAYSGSLGVGLTGSGIGAGASVAILASNVQASVVNSSLRVAGDVDVVASSTRSVDMVTAAGGMGASVGIGGAASLLLSGIGSTGDSAKELGATFGKVSEQGQGKKVDAASLEGTLGSNAAAGINAKGSVDIGELGGRDDLVQARIVGGTVAADEVHVNATTRMNSSNRAGGLGVGGVAVGGAFAMTGLYGKTLATLAADEVEANDVQVVASAGDNGKKAIELDVYAGAAGLGGLGAAVGVARLEQQVVASVGGELQAGGGGTLKVAASDASSVDAEATGVAMGALAVGAVVVDARRSVQVRADLLRDSIVSGFRDVALAASSGGGVKAQAVGASGGLSLAGTAAWADASDTSSVDAMVGDNAAVLGATRRLAVEADAAPSVSANAVGVAVAGTAAIGLSLANASSSAKVNAGLGKGVTVLGSGKLSVLASVSGGKVDAGATAGSGGLVFAGTGVSASTDAKNTVAASIGEGTEIVATATTAANGTSRLTGDVTVKASNDSRQSAIAKGLTIGGLAAVGVVNAASLSESSTKTTVGKNVLVYANNVELGAAGTGETTATAIAGAGGAIAGNASLGSTSIKDTTSVGVGDGASLMANQIVLDATRTSNYGGRADSSAAGLIGASGAKVDNQVRSDVEVNVGKASLVSGGGITIGASNKFGSSLGGTPAVSGSGAGVITGSAASLNTKLTGTSKVNIGSGAVLTANATGERDRLSVVAETTARTSDTATLTTGALASVAVVQAEATANFNNDVSVGDAAELRSNRALNIGTVADVDVRSNAYVSSNGGVAVGKSDAKTNITVDESVNLARKAIAYSIGNAYLTAGRDWRDGGRTSSIVGGAVSQGYVRGLIAVPDSSATVLVNNTATTSLAQGSELKSGSYVWLGSYAEDVARQASGSGTGYQLGFIPITKNDSRNQGSSKGVVTVDGEVVAGRYNTLNIVIGADGKIAPSTLPAGDQIAYGAKEWKSEDLKKKLQDEGNHAYDKAAGMSSNAWVFDNLFAGGGDVTLHGDVINGTGSVTAKGAPTITITNNSNHNIVLAGDVSTTDWNGGSIQFTGKSTNVGGVRLSQEAAGKLAEISIRNLGGAGSAILQWGDLVSRSGNISMFNAMGSIWASGTATGESIDVRAPNGEIGIDTDGGSWWAMDPSVLWKNESLRYAINDANDAAGYLANVMWGADAKAANKTLTDYLLYRNSDGNNNNGTGSILIYGGCMYRNNGDCNKGDMEKYYADGAVQSKYAYGSENWLPRVDFRELVKSLPGEPTSVTNAATSASPSGGWSAGTGIKIVAGYLDINAPLTAGKGVDWSAQVLGGGNTYILVGWNGMTPVLKTLNQQIDEWNRTATTLQKVDSRFLGTTSTAGGARQIELYYDPIKRSFVAPENIDATGGGSIYLDGFIASTSTKGSLNVISGKGSVVIDTSGVAGTGLVLNNITVGNSASGTITIVDRQRKVKTEYIKDSGGSMRATAQDILGPFNPSSPTAGGLPKDWQSQPLVLGVKRALGTSGDSTTYAPASGLRAKWTESAAIKRSSGNSVWEWVDAAGNVVDLDQAWTTGRVSYYVDTSDTSKYRSTVGGGLSNDVGLSIGYACEKGVKEADSCGKFNFGFPSNQVRWDGKTYRTRWNYDILLNGRITVSNSVTASNPIAINFVSNDLSVLSAKASNDILLAGVLKNRAGNTKLESVSGSIVSGSGNASIVSNSVTLLAEKGTIGAISKANPAEAFRPVNVQLVSHQDNATSPITPAGTLVARAGGDIALNVDSAAIVDVDATRGAVAGDVWLTTKYDLTGVSATAASVSGRNIWLTSGGTIGSLTRPLVIRAIERLREDGGLEGGVVTAQATGNIGLRDVSGDFWVNSITSTGGDVLVDAASGSIYDASQRSAVSMLSAEEIKALRDELKLWGGVADISATRYEAQVNAAYAEYFQLMKLGTVSGADYQAGANAISLFRSTAEAAKGMALDDAGVAAYLSERYRSVTGVFSAAFGGSWAGENAFANGFVDGYRYELGNTAGDSASLAAIKAGITQGFSENSVWTANELLHVFNANAMGAGGGSAISTTPIISGRNITLKSNKDLGRLDKTFDVSRLDIINGLIGDDAALAMRLANTPGDIELRDAKGALLSWDDVLAGAAVASLRIKSTAPVVIDAKGQVDAVVAGDAFLRGASSLVFKSFSSGGNARIGSAGDILGAPGANGTVISVGKDLSLDALLSIMGDGDQPLKVQVNGTLLLANAGQHVKLAQQSGDLRIGVVNANENVVLAANGGSLFASGSILDALKGLTALTGRNIQLTVRDNIQEADGTSLAIQILPGGQLDGSAGKDIRLVSADEMPIGVLTAGGDLQLHSTGGGVVANQLGAGKALTVTGNTGVRIGRANAGGDATVSAPLGDVRVDRLVAGSAGLNAGKGLQLGDADVATLLKLLAVEGVLLRDGATVNSGDTIDAEGARFTMGAGSSMSAGKVVAVRSASDITLGKVAVSGNGNGSNIGLTAAGAIVANGDNVLNIGGGSNVHATLQAGTGIGTATSPLVVDVGLLARASTDTGDIALRLPNGGAIGALDAVDGSVLL